MIKKSQNALIVLLLLVISSLNYMLGLMLFLISFQIGLVFEFIKEIKRYRILKKGIQSFDILVNYRRLSGLEDEFHTYEGELEFFWPDEKAKFIIRHKFSSFLKPKLHQKFTIIVNGNCPSESYVMQLTKFSWIFKISTIVAVFLALLFIDYNLMMINIKL